MQVQFQSTLPRGSDMKGMGFLPIIFKISIHAPSRERQVARLSVNAPVGVFQSTLPRGSDRRIAVCFLFSSYFNPRSLAGATSVQPYRHGLADYFNPRSLAGATILNCIGDDRKKYFNPRSLAGATRPFCQRFAADIISIHAPSRERHLQFIFPDLYNGYFNPRSLAGAT